MDQQACLTARDVSVINQRITKCEDNDKSFPVLMETCFKSLSDKVDLLIKANDTRMLNIEQRITQNETNLKIYNSNQGRDVQVMAEKMETRIKDIEKLNDEQQMKITKIYWTFSILGALYALMMPSVIWLIEKFFLN